jgi:hypothetical protein
MTTFETFEHIVELLRSKLHDDRRFAAPNVIRTGEKNAFFQANGDEARLSVVADRLQYRTGTLVVDLPESVDGPAARVGTLVAAIAKHLLTNAKGPTT